MNRIILVLPLSAALLTGCGTVSPLHNAAMANNAAQVRSLLADGADLNAYTGAGKMTALHLAARSGATEAARALIEAGAEVSAKSYLGTPREIALSARKHKTADLLAAYEMRRLGQSVEIPGDAAPAPRASAAAPLEKKGIESDIDAPARRGAERPDDFALVIGIEDYQSVPNADFGARDAKTVRKHLEALGFPARNIISLTGSEATGSKLKSYLEEWLPLNVKESSTLFFYYSGHGAPDIKTGDAYLVPWDGDPKFLKTSALPLTKLYADLSKTKAKRVIVALDACFSGAGGRSVLAKGARPLIMKLADAAPAHGNITVFAAASGDEITGSLDEQGHGMFTYHLLKGLSADPKASAKSLFEYVTPRVQDDARRQNRVQTPVLAGAALTEPLLAP